MRFFRIYNVYITNQFQTIFARRGVGEQNLFEEVTVNSKEEISFVNYVQEFGLYKSFLQRHVSSAKRLPTGLEEENNRKDSCSRKICISRVADPDPERIRIPLGC